MRSLTKLIAVAALALLTPTGPAPAESYRSPLSQGYPSPHGSAYRGATPQAPALWYYGPSYSGYYYSAPPRRESGTSASDYYRPSAGYDPFYGAVRPDYGYGYPWAWLRY